MDMSQINKSTNFTNFAMIDVDERFSLFLFAKSDQNTFLERLTVMGLQFPEPV